MRQYDVLFSYLKESNFSHDGSPADNDDYHLIGTVIAKNQDQVKTWIENNDLWRMETEGRCKEITKLFHSPDYAEDTLEAKELLSRSGHPVEKRRKS